jgi:hypothetical protein
VVPAEALARAGAPPRLRLLPAPGSEPPYDDEVAPGPVLHLVRPMPTRRPRAAPRAPNHPPVLAPADDLPAARPFAVALVHRLLEVRGGARPVLQLQRDTTPGLYADLERALSPGSRGRRPRPAGPAPSGRDVHSVHVQQRPGGVAEVCATVVRGDRMGALALRLEGVGGRWLCTQVQGL